MTKTINDKIAEGREYRNLTLEVRAKTEDKEDYIVEGYATTFNTPYELYRYGKVIVNEQVDREALSETDLSDVIFQYNHEGRVFARTSNKTLELNIDDHGLKVTADLGGTETGRQLYEEIKGGYTTKMSFGFIVAKDKEERTEDTETEEVTYLRTILGIKKIFDVSAVSIPANDTTDITARAYCDGVIEKEQAECRRVEARRKQAQRIRIMTEVCK